MAHPPTLALLLLATASHAQAQAQIDLLATDADLVFAGESFGDRFGTSVTAIDDINKDGLADLAIGAYLNTRTDPETILPAGGRVNIFTTNNGLLVTTIPGDENACFGFALASRDGKIAVGAPCVGEFVESTGRAFIVTPLGFELASFLPPFPARFELLGTAISFIDDLTGDGIPDVIAGGFATADIADNGSGRTHLYNGVSGSRIRTHTGDNEGDNFGIAVSPLDDLTGDGVPEIIIGASGNDAAANNAGKAYIYSGSDGQPLFPSLLEGQNAFAGFGRSVADMGDLDGDGVGDFAISAPGADLVTIFSGADASVLQNITPDFPGAFGRVIINAGDIDGDGFNDIAVGAPSTGDGVGAVYVISAINNKTIYTVTGELTDTCFGCALTQVPDINNDGRPELLIGAPFWNFSTGRAYLFFAPPSPCRGDTNGDGVIGSSDLARLLASWNTNNPEVDFNSDGVVNIRDLSDLLGAWGSCV